MIFLEQVDGKAEQTSRSRSQMFEVWLRLASRQRHREARSDTLACHASRTAEQEFEDEALSRASLLAAGKRKIDS